MSGEPVRLSVRWTGPTKDAVDAQARAEGLSISAVTEQLICEALAARTRVTIADAATPALSAGLDAMIRERLGAVGEQLELRLEIVLMEIATTRLLTTAVIMYGQGDTAARQAEEACLRIAGRAVKKGEMASLPPGICR